MNKALQEENMNKAFTEPAIEIVRFDVKDVITASPTTDPGKDDLDWLTSWMNTRV